MEQTNLSHHLLIAMPTMLDERFQQTVTYICEHSEEGAMRIIINQLAPLKVSELMAQMVHADDVPKSVSLDDKDKNSPIYIGGPVNSERGFVLHTGNKQWSATTTTGPSFQLTSSRDILLDIATHKGPTKHLIALGYAGWAANQLETEMAENAWLSTPATESVVFDLPPEQRWQGAAALIGVDLSRLSSQIGHA